ncbi:cytochrome c oxidase assembly factor CtaG [Solibacillus sp. FSL H8-0538]|uniref:cytochrome c oxidase assembly factor CtaG n=1 Tax=Solibacillus sp. FSL H8-0538 TaxID=2921400 RepID=UPI0030F65BBD
MPLSIFGFQALWSPYLMGVIVFLTVLYFLVTKTWRKDFQVSEPLKKSEAAYFLIGMITLYIVKGSPIDLLGHIMFTWHMVQMALLLLLVPVFLIKGIPPWVWKVIVEAPFINKVMKVFTQPLFAILLFVGLFSFYHLPSVFDTIKLDETLHGLYTFILFLSAVNMYWPLLNNVEGQHQLKNIHKLGYIAANAVLITPACALIIFASHPLYGTYSDSEMWLKAMELCVPASTLSGLSLSGPELFSNMSLVSDQQVGGVLMKIIQEIIFGVILFKVFRKWWNTERANQDEITADALREFQKKSTVQ